MAIQRKTPIAQGLAAIEVIRVEFLENTDAAPAALKATAVRYLLGQAGLQKAPPVPVDVGSLARYDRPMPSVADYDTLLPGSRCVGTA
jgi:hypothetical protein